MIAPGLARADAQRLPCYLTAGRAENLRFYQRFGFQVVEATVMPDGSELVTPIIPVVIGDDWKAAQFWKALFDAEVYTNVALYPAVPRGGALLRTSVMATHEREHLDRALEAFERVGEELGVV